VPDRKGSSGQRLVVCTAPASPSNYFLSPTGSDLKNAFKQIGQELSMLRISQ
jgi:hypothetical protein